MSLDPVLGVSDLITIHSAGVGFETTGLEWAGFSSGMSEKDRDSDLIKFVDLETIIIWHLNKIVMLWWMGEFDSNTCTRLSMVASASTASRDGIEGLGIDGGTPSAVAALGAAATSDISHCEKLSKRLEQSVIAENCLSSSSSNGDVTLGMSKSKSRSMRANGLRVSSTVVSMDVAVGAGFVDPGVGLTWWRACELFLEFGM